MQRREAEEEIERLHVSVDEEQAVTRGVLQESQHRATIIDELKRDLAATAAEVEVHRQEQIE